MLTPEQKQNVSEWLYNLETTELKQGKHSLVDTNFVLGGGNKRYCCLGIAAETVLHDLDSYPTYASKLYEQDAEKLGLYQKVSKEEVDKLILLGVISYGREGMTRESVCIRMNDSKGLTFPEIANVFRKMGWDND